MESGKDSVAVPWVPETFLALFPEDVSAFGQHRKFPPHARKTSGTQGSVAVVKVLKIHISILGTWEGNLAAGNTADGRRK